jgi:thiamine biosynthesis protein ThiS
LIIFNGKEHEWQPGLTLENLLKEMDEEPGMVVVRINGKIILKKDYNTCEIPDNAEVNTVEIIAGG